MRPTREEITQRFQANIARSIAEHGIHIQPVGASEDSPSFVYTVGMTNIGAPELIVFGVSPQSIAPLLFQIFHEIRMGGRPAEQTAIHDMAEEALMLEPVDYSIAADIVGQGDVYLRNLNAKPTYKQLMWPDESGKYPNQRGFDPKLRALQPFVGINQPRLIDEVEDSGPSLH